MLSLRKITRVPPKLNISSFNIGCSRKLSTVQTIKQGQSKHPKPYAEIPGPKPLPIVGNVHRLLFTSKPLRKRILDIQVQDIKTYGGISKEASPGRSILRISEPADVAKVLRCEAKYPKRFEVPLFDYYRDERKKRPGVFFLNGPEWHKHRSIISKRLLRPKEVAEYVPVFNEITSELVSRIRKIRGDLDEVKNLNDELFRWSFESVAYVVLDKRMRGIDRPNYKAQQFTNAVKFLLESIASASLLPVWFYKHIYQTKSCRKFVDSFDQMYFYAELFLKEKIKELESQPEPLETSEENGSERVEFLRFLLSSKKLTKDDLLDSIIDLLFGGVETTSSTTQWALYLMGKHPRKQEKLFQEVTSVLGRHEHPTPHTLSKMPYLKAWVKETLRFYPVVVSLPRMSPEDLVLSGYHVPAGTQIEIPLYAMGRNEKIFDDANSFKPERWMRDNETNKSGIPDPFASLPFGFGQRMCLGRRLAELEIYLVLARMVQEFRINYPENEFLEPVFIGTIKPDRPVRVRFRDRKQ